MVALSCIKCQCPVGPALATHDPIFHYSHDLIFEYGVLAIPDVAVLQYDERMDLHEDWLR